MATRLPHRSQNSMSCKTNRACRTARKRMARRYIFEPLEDRRLLAVYSSGDVPQAIPDQSTITSVVSVPDAVTIDDVNVQLDISHKSDQDLDVYLIAPDGTRVELFTDVGGGGDHFSGTTLDDEAVTSIAAGSAPFSGSFRPEGSLAALDGKDAQGDWLLEITDDKRRKTGTLNSWSIELTPAGPPTLSISDVTVSEGDASSRFIDDFVPTGNGGLDNPKLSVFGPDGNFYQSSSETDEILRYDGTSGAFLGAFVTAGSGGLDGPHWFAFGSDRNLYVNSRNSDEVLRYDGTTGAFLGTFVSAGSGGLDTPNTSAFGPDGNLYVTSHLTNEILRYDGASGAFIDTFVTAGSGGLEGPWTVIFGPDDNLYVSGIYTTDSILRYQGPAGVSPGTFIDAFVTAGSGGLDRPTGMVFGPDGNLYTASSHDRVLRYSATTGEFIDTYVAPGSGGLDSPMGLLFDASGNLYVSSRDTDEVLRFGPASQAAFTVSLSSPSSLPVTVDFATADGTATVLDDDYTATSGTITFALGVTTRTILVPTIDNAAEESTESFVVNLSAATGAVIQDDQGEATIQDDDAPETVVFSDSFEVGTWNGLWVEDSQNDWFRSTQRATDGSYSAEVDGRATDATLTMASSVDLSSHAAATLTFSWYIESGFDSGEYLALDVFDGAWQEVRRLRGNVDQENTWHQESVDLSAYMAPNFQIRFRAQANKSNEDGNVDDVQIVASGSSSASASASLVVLPSLLINQSFGDGGTYAPLRGETEEDTIQSADAWAISNTRAVDLALSDLGTQRSQLESLSDVLENDDLLQSLASGD